MEHFKRHLDDMIGAEAENAKRETYEHHSIELEPEGPIIDALVRLSELRRIKDLPDEEVIPAADRFLDFMIQDRAARFPEPGTRRILGATRLAMNRQLGWTISDLREAITAYKRREARAAQLAAENATRRQGTVNYVELGAAEYRASIQRLFDGTRVTTSPFDGLRDGPF